MEYSFMPRMPLPPPPIQRTPESVDVMPLNSSDLTTHSNKSIDSSKLKLTYRKGPLLESIEIFAIFLGKDWRKEPNAKLAQDINEFFNFIVRSAFIDQLKEYNAENQQIEYGSFKGDVILDPPNLHSAVTDNEIRNLMRQGIRNNTFPSPTENTVYFIYLSPGMTVIDKGGLCAYQENIDESIFYTVIAYPEDSVGCQQGLNTFDTLTVNSSHKIADLITGKLSRRGWYNDKDGDVGDVCLGQTKKLEKFTVQKVWSNISELCM